MTRSVLARRLVEPTWLKHPVYVETFGPEVAELCALADFAPDAEQELLLDLLFAIGPDGKSVVFDMDVVAPRQNLKTGFLIQAELGWLYVTEQRLIVHSAHELDTTAEAFRDLSTLIENTSALSRRLRPTRGERQGITEGNGRWSIELVDDRRIRYKARTAGGGRGLSGDKVVLDEGQALQPAMMGALLPTLSARPDPQVVTAASAGMLASAVLRDKRDRGRAGSSPRQVYAEWGDKEAGSGCAPPDCRHLKTAEGCAFDDEARWARIMPALGRRVQVDTVRAMRQSMPPEEFGREFMVWWDDPPIVEDEQIFGPAWRACAVPDARQPAVDAIGLAVSLDGSWGSIGAHGMHGDLHFAGAVARRRGYSWMADEAVRIAEEHDLRVGVDGGGPAAVLLTEAFKERLGDRLLVLDTAKMKDAYADFRTAVVEEPRQLAHMSHDALDEAVMGAVERMVGDRPLVGRKQSASDVSMLEAVIVAKWVATQPDNSDGFNIW